MRTIQVLHEQNCGIANLGGTRGKRAEGIIEPRDSYGYNSLRQEEGATRASNSCGEKGKNKIFVDVVF